MPVALPPKYLEGLTLQISAPCYKWEINGQERISYMLSIEHANRQGSGSWSLGWLTAQHPVVQKHTVFTISEAAQLNLDSDQPGRLPA